MQIKVKRFDKSLPLPSYKTSGAACLDLYSRESVTIEPHQVGFIPLNVALEIPEDCWVMVAARGSTHKLGIMMANGFCVGDPDFKGDNDEYLFPALNFTNSPVTISQGIRIAQMMVIKHERVEIEEVSALGEVDRGKFGSTGLK